MIWLMLIPIHSLYEIQAKIHCSIAKINTDFGSLYNHLSNCHFGLIDTLIHNANNLAWICQVYLIICSKYKELLRMKTKESTKQTLFVNWCSNYDESTIYIRTYFIYFCFDKFEKNQTRKCSTFFPNGIDNLILL